MMQIVGNYSHTKIGAKLFTLCDKHTLLCIRHPIIYYFLNLTWGILGTLFGFIIFLVFLPFSKPHKYGLCIYQEIGPDYWGGFSLGLFTFKDKKETVDGIIGHEFGHTFQNSIFGPFYFFIVAIPSFIRYWYHTIRNKKRLPNKPYDSIWFEDSATWNGKYAIEELRIKERLNN